MFADPIKSALPYLDWEESSFLQNMERILWDADGYVSPHAIAFNDMDSLEF